MRQTILFLGVLALLVAQPLAAAEPWLTPGKPAGVKPAQAGVSLEIFGGVAFFAALLAVTIGVSGSSVSSTAAKQDSFAGVAVSTGG